MALPSREARLAENKSRRAAGKSEKRKPKVETTSEDFYALLHPHALAVDIEGMTSIFQHVNSEGYARLCADLGVSQDQFNQLLIWTYAEEYPGSKMGQDWDNYELERLLGGNYLATDNEQNSNRYPVKLYSQILKRRIISLGEEGILALPNEILDGRKFIEDIAIHHLAAGNTEAALKWIRRFYELTRGNRSINVSSFLWQNVTTPDKKE